MNISIITNTGKKEDYKSISKTLIDTLLNKISERNDIKLLEIIGPIKNINIGSGIETLVIKKSLLSAFPDLTNSVDTLRVINITTSKIEKIPDLNKFSQLEELTIEDAYIKDIDYSFPNNLRNLNLSYNQISNSFFEVLNFFPNDIVSINISHNFITIPPPESIRHKVNYYCNNIEQKLIFTILIDEIFKGEAYEYDARIDFGEYKYGSATFRNPRIHNIDTDITMFDSTQTVHIGSINDSASKSIKNIVERVKDYPVNNNYLDEILYEFYGNWLFRSAFYFISIKLLKGMVNDISVHSVTHITYGQLLERVWKLISIHPEKNNLIVRLKTEIHESFGFCFTGRINRLINSLSGFIDNIGITISTKEEVQNEILLVIKRYGDEKITKEEALNEVNEIFKYREDLDEPYKRSWIEALEEY